MSSKFHVNFVPKTAEKFAPPSELKHSQKAHDKVPQKYHFTTCYRDAVAVCCFNSKLDLKCAFASNEITSDMLSKLWPPSSTKFEIQFRKLPAQSCPQKLTSAHRLAKRCRLFIYVESLPTTNGECRINLSARHFVVMQSGKLERSTASWRDLWRRSASVSKRVLSFIKATTSSRPLEQFQLS